MANPKYRIRPHKTLPEAIVLEKFTGHIRDYFTPQAELVPVYGSILSLNKKDIEEFFEFFIENVLDLAE